MVDRDCVWSVECGLGVKRRRGDKSSQHPGVSHSHFIQLLSWLGDQGLRGVQMGSLPGTVLTYWPKLLFCMNIHILTVLTIYRTIGENHTIVALVTREMGPRNHFQRKVLFNNQFSDYRAAKVSLYST